MRAKSRRALLGAVLVVAAASSVWALWLRDRRPPGASTAKGVSAPELVERWGVDAVRVMSTAAGNLLDFRYRVVDAAKAAVVQKRDAHPYLVDLKSGLRLACRPCPRPARSGTTARSSPAAPTSRSSPTPVVWSGAAIVYRW